MDYSSILWTLLVALSLVLAWSWLKQRLHRSNSLKDSEKIVQHVEQDPYASIKSLPDFDWSTTEPIKIRPFKPKYHLTMALENLDFSELIPMDKTFQARLKLRRRLIADHPASTLQCNPIAVPAVLEFYTWMTQTYLPTRFPTIYHISEQDQTLLNTVTNTSLRLVPSSPLVALRSLAENIDHDFLFLLPKPRISTDSTPVYVFQAFAACFPSGFSTRAKCGLTLSAIHTPVPGYAARLEKSMDRFFARLEVGKLVKRANWSISTDDVLFKETGNHLYSSSSNSTSSPPSDSGAEEAELEKLRAAVNVEDCRVRCERQTLHRLPETKALVFAFKTYMYTLDEVKRDGDAEALAQAIEGLGAGNAPEMEFYKRGVVWGDKVLEFLRAQ